MSVTTSQWFELNEDSEDLINTINFVKNLPANLMQICGQDSFKDLVNKDFEAYEINYNLFYEAFEEAESVLSSEPLIFMGDDIYVDDFTIDTLHYIGFAGSSLKLKAGILNKLWQGVISAGDGVINFANNAVVKALRKFLTYLNSLLGSLKALFPAIDAIKEIKEAIESYLSFAEEGDDIIE